MNNAGKYHCNIKTLSLYFSSYLCWLWCHFCIHFFIHLFAPQRIQSRRGKCFRGCKSIGCFQLQNRGIIGHFLMITVTNKEGLPVFKWITSVYLVMHSKGGGVPSATLLQNKRVSFIVPMLLKQCQDKCILQ